MFWMGDRSASSDINSSTCSRETVFCEICERRVVLSVSRRSSNGDLSFVSPLKMDF